MPRQPLAEVFGFPPDNFSPQAERHRKHRLCPFNNRIANCTKDKANDPLGVCSVVDIDNSPAITCPIRFRQDWLIAEDAAEFFFPPSLKWTSLTEVRLNDQQGQSAGNIDLVLVAYDQRGVVVDFGALEVQAVYISGNVRRPFEYYMGNPAERYAIDWRAERNYPRPDYLSSSRKRLAPQLLYKGGILHAWKKRQAVALHEAFFQTLPQLDTVDPTEAEMAWLIYDLQHDPALNQYRLRRVKTVYTQFQSAMLQITTPPPSSLDDFMGLLQEKLDAKLENGDSASDNTLLSDLI